MRTEVGTRSPIWSGAGELSPGSVRTAIATAPKTTTIARQTPHDRLDARSCDVPLPSNESRSSAFGSSVVVGSMSAALVIDGEIRAAVRLDGETSVSLEVRNGGVVLSDLHVGPPPPNSGCGG